MHNQRIFLKNLFCQSKKNKQGYSNLVPNANSSKYEPSTLTNEIGTYDQIFKRSINNNKEIFNIIWELKSINSARGHASQIPIESNFVHNFPKLDIDHKDSSSRYKKITYLCFEY